MCVITIVLYALKNMLFPTFEQIDSCLSHDITTSLLT